MQGIKTRPIKVIGVTSTGMAMRWNMMREFGIKVVILEEAGQIPESHSATSILSGVQHVIMIGDHLQLRTHTNLAELTSGNCNGKTFALDLSVLERMITGYYSHKIPFATLKTQYRMVKSLAQIPRNTIYPFLLDGNGTEGREGVHGVAGVRVFWRHGWPEMRNEAGSWSNDGKVEMIARLLGYLKGQEQFERSQFAVLTPYMAQKDKSIERIKPIFDIIKMKRDDGLEGVAYNARGRVETEDDPV